jgi:hypothetical protein
VSFPKTNAEMALFTTVQIENQKGQIGTGFCFQVDTVDGKYAQFLVTNKHVVKDSENGDITFLKGDKGRPLLGSTHTLKKLNFNDMWVGHPDPEIDVCVTGIQYLLNEYVEKQGIELFFLSIDQSLLLASKELEEVDALEEIVFIGYPKRLMDPVNKTPIIRKGTTATPILLNYDGRKQFLVDASIFPGSSGSPVYLYNSGSYHRRDGSTVIGNRFKFLGIISERLYWLPDPETTRKESLDIGIVYKASTICETIREASKVYGWNNLIIPQTPF